MIRISVGSLSLAALLLLAASPATSQSVDVHSPDLRLPEKLSSQDLHKLITAAKTPEDHSWIARYYELRSLDYRAQAQKHARMLANFMAQSATNNDKTQSGTIAHCDYMFRSLNQRAREAQRLAHQQEELAHAVRVPE